eukprot:gb/GFBE01010882.1/.p1 GENE.gb/GFBE01010882.1/~~gb/GFBE01010882.1/.p1  ORF type:complete len:219 (+),score=40.76 gb/GFBE01010882.1/:1-657(+)
MPQPRPPMEDCKKCSATGTVQRLRGTKGMDCTSCKACYCADCGGIWSVYHSCAFKKQIGQRIHLWADQFQHEKEFAVELAPFGYKMCPRCKVPADKDEEDDCDHMYCRNKDCRHEFCWQCFADRRLIAAHGNHYHEIGCPFYFAYDGPAEFVPDRCDTCKKTGHACLPPDQFRQLLPAEQIGVPVDGHTAAARRRQHERMEMKMAQRQMQKPSRQQGL